jgi:tRNA threonylcarbamoyladenosine biosynthesis protein TsaE
MLMATDFTLALADEQATLQCAARLAQGLRAGLAIYLHGDLSAGKTTLVRGVLQALGYHGKVKSPSYSLLELYEDIGLPYAIYHFDLYRFQDEQEWHAAGFREYFNAHSVCFVEWPEKAGHLLPPPDIAISLSHQATGRSCRMQAHSQLGAQCLNAISS